MQQPEPTDAMLSSYMLGFETGLAKQPMSGLESMPTLQGYAAGLKLAAEKTAKELEDTKVQLEASRQETTLATVKASRYRSILREHHNLA